MERREDRVSGDMKYRNVFIANKCYLSTNKNCLVIDNGEKDSVPIEDIRCVMIDNRQTTMSAALLSKLALSGATVMVCDELHLPTACLLPVNHYSRQLKQLQLQIDQTIPSKKRIWTQIVKAKINNQAKCLTFCGMDEESKKLSSMATAIKVGDPQNTEGRAAALYFKALFGSAFRRSDDNEVNASLNYGYSIIRSYIARTLAVYGLEPVLGVHHKSELNNFNLADDLLEPFRPIVDLYTFLHMVEEIDFSTAYRAELLSIMNMDMLSKNQYCSIDVAVERLVQSLVACYRKTQTNLVLPELIELQFHRYS